MSKHADDVAEYVDGVISGRIVTGRLARLAVWRYLDDLKYAGDRGFYFDASYAEEFLDFSELCCHTQGEWAGKPFTSEPWQKFCDWNLFGWRRSDNGFRRFREDLECLARKQGKTTRCGPKSIYLSRCDNPIEVGGQGYCVATKEDQAKLLFDEVKRMLSLSPALRGISTPFQKRITFPSTQSYMQVLGSDSDSQDGFNPHFIIRDELHAWRERHRGLAEKLSSGFGARRQPLLITITTAGDDLSCLWQEDFDYAVRVLESVITGEIVDDTLFAFLCCIDHQSTPCFRCKGPNCPWCKGTGQIPVDDPFDESIWIKANPNLGVSVSYEYMRERANKAKNKPVSLNEFLRYHCNIRVAATERAISPEAWSDCEGELSDWSTADSVHGGFDLGRSDDFAANAKVASFNCYDDDGEPFTRYEIKSRSYTSETRDESIRNASIDKWIKDGHISASYGNAIDLNDFEDDIVRDSEQYSVKTWAYDPNFAHQMGQTLANEYGIEVFKFTQKPRFYNEPIRKFLALLSQTRIVNGERIRLIRHDGCPVLAWQMGNLIVKRNAADEWMPDKSNKSKKIDAAVAVLMAFSECLYAAQDETSGYYLNNPLALGGVD